MSTMADINQTDTITGGTDGSVIGNTGDRLKVDANITGTISPQFTTNKLRYVDMNASSGGVARGTSVAGNSTWVSVFSYTGSGYLLGFCMNLATATTGWQIRLVIDTTEEVFGATGLLTSEVDTLYTYTIGTSNTPRAGAGLGTTTSMFYWSSPLDSPIKYNSKVQVFVMRATGQIAKTFNAGLLTLTKDT